MSIPITFRDCLAASSGAEMRIRQAASVSCFDTKVFIADFAVGDFPSGISYTLAENPLAKHLERRLQSSASCTND